MRLPTLLLNLLMLLAIVVNTIPAHAHAPMAALATAAAHDAVAEALDAAGVDGETPCHDGSAADEPGPPAVEPVSEAVPPCCDGSDGGCDCACLMQVAALASAVPRLPASALRAAPAGLPPAGSDPPSLASLIRPPIG